MRHPNATAEPFAVHCAHRPKGTRDTQCHVVFNIDGVLHRAYLTEGPADQALSAASISIANAAKANATGCPPLLCRVRLVYHIPRVAPGVSS